MQICTLESAPGPVSPHVLLVHGETCSSGSLHPAIGLHRCRMLQLLLLLLSGLLQRQARQAWRACQFLLLLLLLRLPLRLQLRDLPLIPLGLLRQEVDIVLQRAQVLQPIQQRRKVALAVRHVLAQPAQVQEGGEGSGTSG